MSLNSLNTGPPPAHPHRVLTVGNRIIISHPLLVVGVGWGGVISNPQSSLIIPEKEVVPWLTRANVLFVFLKKKKAVLY